jgi:hypothetical protein
MLTPAILVIDNAEPCCLQEVNGPEVGARRGAVALAKQPIKFWEQRVAGEGAISLTSEIVGGNGPSRAGGCLFVDSTSIGFSGTDGGGGAVFGTVDRITGDVEAVAECVGRSAYLADLFFGF